MTKERLSMSEILEKAGEKLYDRKSFWEKAESFLATAAPGEYSLIAIDIEHFKLFNEWYGKTVGNLFLKRIGRYIAEAVGDDGLAAYMGEDDFCVILPNDGKTLFELQRRIRDYILQQQGNAGFLPAYGVYEVEDTQMPLTTIYDRAIIALNSVKGNYARRIGWYDVRMKEKLEESHLMLREVQRAIENDEITFFLQPKCSMTDGKIVGMEALVRWVSPERGIVPPAVFVNVLERNGFIPELDQYIWDKVCARLRTWIDSGLRPVPISVNVSRIDIYTLDVAEVFSKLIQKYSLPPQLIELEITESAYAEESMLLADVVDQLRQAGFRVLMDDFGTGYSSLNMLKDVNVDVLKIDMKFLEMDQKSIDKGLGILETIVRMAKLMGLQLIAEGAESRTQVDFLLDMGCLYGQGYYFYHPLSIADAEKLLEREEKFDFNGMRDMIRDKAEAAEIRKKMSLIITHAPENIFFIRLQKDSTKYEVIANGLMEQYGCSAEQCENSLNRFGAEKFILPKHRERILGQMRKAVQERCDYQDVIQISPVKGRVLWVDLKASYVGDSSGSCVYLCICGDVSEIKEKEQAVWLMGQKLERILRQAGISSWEWDMEKHYIRISDRYVEGRLRSFAELFGGKRLTMEDLEQAKPYLSEQTIAVIKNYLQEIRQTGNDNGVSCDFPVTLDEGQVLWVHAVCAPIRDANGKPIRGIGHYSDITEEKMRYIESRKNIQALERDSLTGLYTRQAAIPKIREYLMAMDADENAAMIMLDLDNFKKANDVFGHIFGDKLIADTARRLRNSFRADDIICRIGGDEFLVLCKNVRNLSLGDKIADALQNMRAVFHENGENIVFSASAGYVMIPEHGTVFEDLYRKSDIALFTAKAEGKGIGRKYCVGMKETRYEKLKEKPRI